MLFNLYHFSYQSLGFNCLTHHVFWQQGNRGHREKKQSFSLVKVLLLWVTLTYKWMIHPTPWPLIFLIFVTNDLLHSIAFVCSRGYTLSHVILAVHVQNLIQASCSLMTASSPSVCLFSHLFIAPLGDLQALPPSSCLDFMARYFSDTFVLPPMICVILSDVLSVLYIPAAPRQMSRESCTILSL